MSVVLLPPHNVEAEEAVLGSMLIDPDAIPRVAAFLNPEDFYIGRHAWVCEAIFGLFERSVPVDFVTLCDELENREGDRKGQTRLEAMRGAAAVLHLINIVPTSIHAEYYGHIVEKAAMRRRLIAAAQEIANLAYDTETDPDEAVNLAASAVLDVWRNDDQVVGMDVLMPEFLNEVDEWSRNPLEEGEVRGLPTGLAALDKALGGLEPALYLLAARPSMGKTSLVIQIASNIALAGKRVLFFSLEMPRVRIRRAVGTSFARVEEDRLKRDLATEDEMYKLVNALVEASSWPLRFALGRKNVNQIRAIIQREKLHGDLAAVIVDGFWLITGAKQMFNRNLELGALSRELKLTADELELPIIAVHQLSRALEMRSDKRPVLSDLRESGRLEEDADVVLMLYRENYYDASAGAATELWVRKNRLGGPANRKVEFMWEGKYTRFEEYTAQEEPDGANGVSSWVNQPWQERSGSLEAL